MLAIIRFFLIGLWGILVFSIGCLLCLIRPFNPDNIYTTGRLLSKGGFWILGIDYELRDLEILDRVRPAVLISNHQDNLDMMPGGITVPKQCALLGKKSLIFIPFFGQFFWLAGNFLIDRKNKRKSKKSMTAVTKRIVEKGVSIWILPEGTRSRGRGLLPFKRGAFVTAVNAKVPIIPICFSSYHKKMKFNQWKAGKIIVKALEPIETSHLEVDGTFDLAEKAHEMMKSEIDKLDGELSL